MNKETVEEAALAYWKTQVRRDTAKRGSTPFCTKDFKAGAEWQKEQSIDDLFKFTEWTHQMDWYYIKEREYWVTGEGIDELESKIFHPRITLTTQQLYELYKQSML